VVLTTRPVQPLKRALVASAQKAASESASVSMRHFSG
jgi:hypothetical protein